MPGRHRGSDAASPPQDSAGIGETPTLRNWPGSAGRRRYEIGRDRRDADAADSAWVRGSQADSEGERGLFLFDLSMSSDVFEA
jgi:hypothetical protein